jgi:protein-L-isoaspartate(D-aspartate) O-methyltransferase
MTVGSAPRGLDGMNGRGRTGLHWLFPRWPPSRLGSWFLVSVFVAVLSVAGMAALFGRVSDGDEDFRQARREMVENHFRRRDITDQRVLEVMERVPRHLYVPANLRESAYEDRPLPIGQGQTISQPYIVALMTQLAKPQPDSKALDVGTGSGYQAAVLGELCKEVYSIEIVEQLAEQAAERLARLGYNNIHVRAGDGYQGWPEHAPFDLIIVAAAPASVPQPLVEQLAPGGRMIIPVGRFQQDLMVIEKLEDGTVREWSEIPVAFVPMTGEAQQSKQESP